MQVKSAYVIARTESVHLNASANGRGTSSDQTCAAKYWKRLWQIKAPPGENSSVEVLHIIIFRSTTLKIEISLLLMFAAIVEEKNLWSMLFSHASMLRKFGD